MQSNFNHKLLIHCTGFIEVGGYEELRYRYFSSYPNTTLQNLENESYPYAHCGIPPAHAYNLVRPADDSDLPWPGVFFGLLVSSIWYWCSDQVTGIQDLLIILLVTCVFKTNSLIAKDFFFILEDN